jgi:hypothetical protein
LLDASQVEIACITQKFSSMLFVTDIDIVPLKQAKEVGEDVAIAKRDSRWEDLWWSEERLTINPWDGFTSGGEEVGES